MDVTDELLHKEIKFKGDFRDGRGASRFSRCAWVVTPPTRLLLLLLLSLAIFGLQ